MQLIKRIIPLAKDRALKNFSVLARNMVADAETAMLQDMASPRAGVEHRGLGTALQVLRQEQADIIASIDARFQDSVDRGMRTMYTDLRQGFHKLSADTMSLIDDETVNRQLEVGNLVQRLRDACDENLGRLNIIIAQMHGDAEVHERENPFRPYLIARALYETLKDRVDNEDVGKILFARLSDSLALQLPGYYASICEVFDANGIQARLLARPTSLKRHQRDQLAQQLAAMNSTAGMGHMAVGAATLSVTELNSRLQPALQRMFETMRGANNADNAADTSASAIPQVQPDQAVEFQDFVWRLFNQAGTMSTHAEVAGALVPPGEGVAGAGAAAPLHYLAGASAEVLQQIDRYQRQAADAAGRDAAAPDERNQLFSLGEQLVLPQRAQGARMAIDVVAVLFEYLLEDEQIPAVVRTRIARLQIPFLKAALLEPQLLQQPDHPARKLLNLIASAAVGLAPDSAMAQRLDGEIVRLVKRILQEFSQDMAIFSDCLRELEQFLADQLANANAETAGSIQAAEEAEKFSAVMRNTTASLRDILTPMEVDQRVKDFIEQVWARVLVRAAAKDATGGAAGMAEQYREILPELVWSAQEKNTQEDRSALMRMLPGLIKRLRIGMLMIHMPENECGAALDRLVPVHTEVLRPGLAGDGTRQGPSLDDLRKEFSRLVSSDDSAAWGLSEPLQVAPDALESALAERGVAADVDLSRLSVYAAAPSAELLTQLQVGSAVEFRVADTAAPARLAWVSKHHALFIFKLEQQAKPLVYSAAALLQALQSGKIGLIEYAPALDRAVDALMKDAEAVQAARL